RGRGGRGTARRGGSAGGALQGAPGAAGSRRGPVVARAAEPAQARAQGAARAHAADRDRRRRAAGVPAHALRTGAASALATLAGMAADTISFARGAPSLDIVDVEGLKDAAA